MHVSQSVIVVFPAQDKARAVNDELTNVRAKLTSQVLPRPPQVCVCVCVCTLVLCTTFTVLTKS